MTGDGTATRMRTVLSRNTGGNQVVQLPPVRVAVPPQGEAPRARVALPPKGKKVASGGRTVTRMRTVLSHNTRGNQVVQLPPVRVAGPPKGERPRARVALPPKGKKAASGGGAATRMRIVLSGNTSGNQVVELPPVRRCTEPAAQGMRRRRNAPLRRVSRPAATR